MKSGRFEFLDWCAVGVLVLCVAVCVRFTLCDSSPTKPDAVQVTQDKTVSHNNFTYIADFDDDGYITAVSWKEACSHAPSDELKELCEAGIKTYLKGVGDCDDQNASVYPSAPEITDGKDNDCNGEVDEKPRCSTNEDCYPPPVGFKSVFGETFWANGAETYGCLDPWIGACGSCQDTDQDGFCDHTP